MTRFVITKNGKPVAMLAPYGKKRASLAGLHRDDVEILGDIVSPLDAMLVAKQRLAIAMALGQWRRDLIAGGIRELPLDGRVGLLAADLQLHWDPADRFIAATATINEATLATADQRLLAWQANVDRLEATQ